MKFPGCNTMTLSEDAIKAALQVQIEALNGADVRITSISLDTYPTRLKVEFTSDPEAPRAVTPLAVDQAAA